MKLLLVRDQNQGMLGKTNFILKVKVKITEEENNLISKYQMGEKVLMYKKVKQWFSDEEYYFEIRIDDLVGGYTFKYKDISEIIEAEELVKESCERLKQYLKIMESFGGNQVIEI